MIKHSNYRPTFFSASFFTTLMAAVLLTSGLLFSATAQADDSALWSKIKSGEYMVLMRHAYAPGMGDPDNFKLDDCSTQRLLDETGRQQAIRIGERFRANGIDAATVYSSPWCRCFDTAELLKLGPVTKSLNLASTFQEKMDDNPAKKTAGVKHWIANLESEAPIVIVTHQVNISALTGTYAGSGEMIIVRLKSDKELEVVGEIDTVF